MAAYADLRLVLSFETYGCHFKILFERCFSCRYRGRLEDDLLIVGRCAQHQRRFVFKDGAEELGHRRYRVKFRGRRGDREKRAKDEIVLSRDKIFIRRGGRGAGRGGTRLLVGARRVGGRGDRHGRKGWIGHRST